MAIEAEELSRLIGDIYDASLDPALWPAVFKQTCKYTGGSAASLSSQDAVGITLNIHFTSGHDLGFEQLYVEKYRKINPIFPTAIFFDVERAFGLTDCIPREEFCRTRFAREWAMPQGYIDAQLCNIEKSASNSATLTIMRHINDGFANDEVHRRFALVVPHVRRAILIGKVIDLHKVEAAALADTLDTLVSAMFIVSGSGRIVHANASGYAMLSEARVLRAPNGRLGANGPASEQALLDVFTAAEGGDAALGRRGIAVPLEARDGERYVAHVLPLTSGARQKAGVSYGAVAAVFVRKATIDLPSPPVVMAKEFHLTPAELRVLFSIVEIGGAAEVAEVLGISEATVRTHLHRLFEKTGTSRQADLVKLVAGYCVAP
ncbi:MAG TPA: helix-turn-helix transcriptional regulator [Bradyrhizobium sp.]|jgi:DNA-binding CsgD family transcriptional regulator|nr:helix-turn-helix transcriptional regulator [Bradyrhizobium sp.]